MNDEYVQEHILTGGIVCSRQRGETECLWVRTRTVTANEQQQ
jgi:hypothetical protein